MPAPLKVDWTIIESLYAKGYNFAQISRQTNVSHNAIRKYAERHNWKVTQANVKAAMLCDSSLAERAEHWTWRMSNLVESQLSQIEAKSRGKVGIKALEMLVRIANTLDVMARRTFGLDSGQGVNVTLHVQSEVAQSRQLPDQSQIVDVETVQNQDTNQVQTDKSSETPTNPT